MLSDLMDSKYSVIDTHYDKLENSNALNPIVRTKYLKFRKFFDEGDREMVASLKKECELVLLNNRKKYVYVYVYNYIFKKNILNY